MPISVQLLRLESTNSMPQLALSVPSRCDTLTRVVTAYRRTSLPQVHNGRRHRGSLQIYYKQHRLRTMMSVNSGHHSSTRGQKLHTVNYVTSTSPSAVLIWHHGYGEHIGRYTYGTLNRDHTLVASYLGQHVSLGMVMLSGQSTSGAVRSVFAFRRGWYCCTWI